jgi:hypothetical protein
MFEDLPNIVKKICNKNMPDITKTDLENLLKTDDIILEEFYDQELHNNDYNDFILENNKPIQTEDNIEEVTTDTLLEEDSPLLTRSALKKQVNNKLHKTVTFEKK